MDSVVNEMDGHVEAEALTSDDQPAAFHQP